MRAKTVNEQQNFERGQDPKRSLGVGGFDFKKIKEDTWGQGIQDWKDFLNSFNGKTISFVAQPDFDTPYVKAGKRITKKVKDWGFNEAMYNHVWFFDANSHPHKQYYIDLDHKVYVVDDVNEGTHFERGQDPKKALGVGLDSENYVKIKLKEKGFDPDDAYEDFMNLFYEGFRDMGDEEFGDHIIYILDKCDPKCMMEYMNDELGNYFQMKEEFGEMP